MMENGQKINKYYEDYNDADTTLFHIFKEYGSSWRPKENPKFDPPKPDDQPKTAKKVIEEEKKEEDEGEVQNAEEPPYEPPCDKILYYEFQVPK